MQVNKIRKFCLFPALLLGFSLSLNARIEPLSWYKCFSGSIERHMITMHLHKMGNEYSGYYYYDKIQQPIYMRGTDTAAGQGKIILFTFPTDNQAGNEIFTLSYSGNTLNGYWQKEVNSKEILMTATEKSDLSISYKMVYAAGSAKLRPGMEESPEASFKAASIWPQGNAGSAAFIKKIIDEMFGAENSEQEIGNILLENKKKFLDDYLQENKNRTDSQLKEFPSAYNLDESQALMIVFQSPKLLILAHFHYSYTGGAHGNYGTSYISINLTNKKRFKIGDILTTDGTKHLRRLLEKNYRKQRGLKVNEPLTVDGLFENKIEPNENFYLTGKGMGFSYAPYEIGPYAMGEINIFISFSEISAYLQPSFKKFVMR